MPPCPDRPYVSIDARSYSYREGAATPLNWLMATTARRAAGTRTFRAEGTPGQAWPPGEFYAGTQLARSHEQAYDGYLARELWDQSAALLSITTA